ncbi:CRISPR-associated endoribonuclease Cas6 [Parafilimonas sp.]|uniref:CRISPR-associated endoribonuclease Cas6 n=1 Tax=Parafilimonas sp. TaxID=1969739 RepID=UPI0039E49585
MRLQLTLITSQVNACIPLNYQYPLSAAIYRIIAKGDNGYASFLHQKGYGKGFKFFTFSQINVPFKIEGDRMRLLGNELSFQVAFHLPQAMESFVKGLFQSEKIDIADAKSKTGFAIRSVEGLPDVLQGYKENEIVRMHLEPLSPVVAGLQNEKGNYVFLSPDDDRFADSLVYNWRNKIATCYDEATASSALLMLEVAPVKQPFKSRLMTIKYGKPEETKIRGWLNLVLQVTAEKRFVELLLNAGAGVYNSMGCGCVEMKTG